MTTTVNMGLVLPVIAGDPGVWGNRLNAALTLVDVHDHSIGAGVKVKPNGLNINSDLTFAGNAATNLKAIAFTAQASYTTSKSLWVNSANDELYYRRAGVDNRLTVGGVLNVALVGGITGDYAAAAAALYYDDAAGAYRFLEAAPSPNSWSYVKAGGFDLYEHASGISNHVQLRSPAALAASYALTFPGALPGSTLAMQMSSAGAISLSNTFAGLITANAGVTLAADQNLTQSGTGEHKHGDKIENFGPFAFNVTSGAFGATVGGIANTGASAVYIGGPSFLTGDRITSFSVALLGDGTVDGSIDVVRHKADGTNTSLGTATLTNVPAAWATTTINITDTTLTNGEHVYIVFTANATGLTIGGMSFTYDHP